MIFHLNAMFIFPARVFIALNFILTCFNATRKKYKKTEHLLCLTRVKINTAAISNSLLTSMFVLFPPEPRSTGFTGESQLQKSPTSSALAFREALNKFM